MCARRSGTEGNRPARMMSRTAKHMAYAAAGAQIGVASGNGVASQAMKSFILGLQGMRAVLDRAGLLAFLGLLRLSLQDLLLGIVRERL